MARDQYGETLHGLDAKYPRKDLLKRLGRKGAQRMYHDTKDGKSHHIGYIVGQQWFTLYTVEEWKRKA